MWHWPKKVTASQVRAILSSSAMWQPSVLPHTPELLHSLPAARLKIEAESRVSGTVDKAGKWGPLNMLNLVWPRPVLCGWLHEAI